MCDTIVKVESDRVLFAKNSDRDANEGQNLVWSPRRTSLPEEPVRCTYISIPDVVETYATLLSQPFWMWGAEMGTNEHGVTIGNEAVFTKEPYEKEPGLIGMDLLRLGLERATTASEAVEVITALLEQYGQGGGCGHESKKFVYHNSFIVADPTEAFVLETAGRKWETEQATGARTISNGLTIPGFRERYSDFINTKFSGSRDRQCRTQALAEQVTGPGDLMTLLQDHGEGHDAPAYSWINGAMSAPCMHAGGIMAASQSTASWVAELRPGDFRHWATGTAAPCTGLFKPVAVDAPVELIRAENRMDDSLWWRHERLHRAVMRIPEKLRPLFTPERDEVQQRWLADPPSSVEAFAEADRLLDKWTEQVLAESTADTRIADKRPDYVRRFWNKREQRAANR